MKLWVIIPVKPFKRSKSRLADVLSPDERAEFAETMFRRVLTTAIKAPQVVGVMVISKDTKALAIAREMGAKSIQETNNSDLNPALTRATEVARIWGAKSILVLPSDLPFLRLEDIEGLVKLGQYPPSVVIAPDRFSNGTNALLVHPPGIIDYSYGEDSFIEHQTLANQLGVAVSIYNSDTIRLDIDFPEDLDIYNRRVIHGHYDGLSLYGIGGLET